MNFSNVVDLINEDCQTHIRTLSVNSNIPTSDPRRIHRGATTPARGHQVRERHATVGMSYRRNSLKGFGYVGIERLKE